MSELRLAVWTVESGEKCRWFPDSGSAREFARNEWDNNLDGVPWINSKTIWDVAEMCEILNNIETHADGAPVSGELVVFSNRMA